MMASVRLVVFGRWTKDWMRALGPESSLWRNHPIVKEVVTVPDVDCPTIPPDIDPSSITIILPLMEWHILKCPLKYLALISDAKVIRTLAIKSNFNKYINQVGLSHLSPKSYTNQTEIVYPFILKRVDLNGGNGISLIESPLELYRHLKHELWFQKDIVFQEYIPGEKEYVSHLVCKNGTVLWHSSFSYTLKQPHIIRRPENIETMERLVVRSAVIEVFTNLLKPLNFSGPCNIDFKITKEGKLKIMEINPRLGGSLMLEENFDLLGDALNCILKALLYSKDF